MAIKQNPILKGLIWKYTNTIRWFLGLRDQNQSKTEATPEQFGALAKRLERDRQMRGEPTNVQKFEKNFNNINTKKPIIKKPFKRSGPVEPIKIDLNNYRPFTPLEPIVKDPQMIEAERRYENVKNEIKEEQYKNAHSGIASIVGGDPKYGK